jgi:tetratricopeptide (TPR) repeat protein
VRGAVAIALVWAVLTGVAYANGYDAFTRGMSALSRGKYDAAVAAFSAALDAGDLVPAYIPTAYFERAEAYLGKKMCPEALSDIENAIKLRPNSREMVTTRIAVNVCLKQPGAVERDFATLMAKRPNAGMHFELAHYQWSVGLWEKSAANCLQGLDIYKRQKAELTRDGADAGADDFMFPMAAWYAVDTVRAQTFDAAALAAALGKYNSNEWPGPLLDFFRGLRSETQVYREADSWRSDRARNQACEADFYLGEWSLAHGDADGAKAKLTRAAEKCPDGYIEKNSAKTELERMPSGW